MEFSTRHKADYVATFRHISVFLMETLARWVPTTPELEVKVLFGRHIWEFAQHADALGKRTAELRLAVQTSRRPTLAFQELLETLAGADETALRVDGFYDAMLPMLTKMYEEYLDKTDHLMDEPTVRILARAIQDFDRLRADRNALDQERSDLNLTAPDFVARLRQTHNASNHFVDFRPTSST